MSLTRHQTVISIARPYHGLGNRVRALFGAVALAEHTGRQVKSIWPADRRFGARLDELWQTDIATLPAWTAPLITARYPVRDHTLTWLDQARDEGTWVIRTAHALHLPEGAPRWEEILRRTPPVAAVAERVREVHSRELSGTPWIGVMVRAHPNSHAETLEHSPVSWYLERLRELRTIWPEVPFFLSCDTSEAEAQIRSEIPGIVSLGAKGGYNSGPALTAAVADLYLLAASAHIIGPHYSSFPELALTLADPGALRLQTSRTGPETAFDPARATIAPDPLRPYERTAVGHG